MGIFGDEGNVENKGNGFLNTIDGKLDDAKRFVTLSATSLYNKVSGKQEPPEPPGPYGTNQGGKRRRSKGKRGGFRANAPLNNIASSAASYSGVKTAQPHNWVGGKSRKGHRKNKSRRNKSRRMRR